MSDRILKSLYDIKNAVAEIDTFFNDRPKVFDNYKKDLLVKRATERNLEIIGEAMAEL
jgi:uncharacterized protein with HEPN domain